MNDLQNKLLEELKADPKWVWNTWGDKDCSGKLRFDEYRSGVYPSFATVTFCYIDGKLQAVEYAIELKDDYHECNPFPLSYAEELANTSAVIGKHLKTT